MHEKVAKLSFFSFALFGTDVWNLGFMFLHVFVLHFGHLSGKPVPGLEGSVDPCR